MARRTVPDPELTRQVADRLAAVLADHGPRRARAAPTELDSLPPPDLENDVDPPAPDLPPAPAARPFRRAHLGVVVGLVVIGLLWAGWAVLRARPVAVASPTGPLTVQTPASSPSPVTAPSSAAKPAALVVHVLGAVRRPGLVEVREGSRVHDAIEAAGGLQRAADTAELNLAQLLVDGEQIVIGTRRKPAGEVRNGSGSTGAGTGSTSSGAAIDLNRATSVQLEQLPGVGPVTAGKIIAWREEHGRFSRVEELQEVDGIGPKTYAQLASHVRV